MDQPNFSLDRIALPNARFYYQIFIFLKEAKPIITSVFFSNRWPKYVWAFTNLKMYIIISLDEGFRRTNLCQPHIKKRGLGDKWFQSNLGWEALFYLHDFSFIRDVMKEHANYFHLNLDESKNIFECSDCGEQFAQVCIVFILHWTERLFSNC